MLIIASWHLLIFDTWIHMAPSSSFSRVPTQYHQDPHFCPGKFSHLMCIFPYMWFFPIKLFFSKVPDAHYIHINSFPCFRMFKYWSFPAMYSCGQLISARCRTEKRLSCVSLKLAKRTFTCLQSLADRPASTQWRSDAKKLLSPVVVPTPVRLSVARHNSTLESMYNKLVQLAPVHCIEDGLSYVHEATGLPWWAVIVLCTGALRWVSEVGS